MSGTDQRIENLLTEIVVRLTEIRDLLTPPAAVIRFTGVPTKEEYEEARAKLLGLTRRGAYPVVSVEEDHGS